MLTRRIASYEGQQVSSSRRFAGDTENSVNQWIHIASSTWVRLGKEANKTHQVRDCSHALSNRLNAIASPKWSDGGYPVGSSVCIVMWTKALLSSVRDAWNLSDEKKMQSIFFSPRVNPCPSVTHEYPLGMDRLYSLFKSPPQMMQSTSCCVWRYSNNVASGCNDFFV